MRLSLYMSAAILAVVSAGCSTDKIHSWTRTSASEVTDFLPGKERLVKHPDTFPVHYTWTDTDAVAKAKITNVYIAPVDISYLRKGNGYDEWRDSVTGLDEAINELGDYAREAFKVAFKEREERTGMKVTDDPTAPNTAILEFAITGFVPTRAEVQIVGTVGSIFCPVPGVGIVADMLAAGEIAVECRVRDSSTGKIIFMFANTEGEPKALLQFAKYTYTAAAKINLKRMANDLAESCTMSDEDISQMRRDFPFSFIATPWDSNLEN